MKKVNIQRKLHCHQIQKKEHIFCNKTGKDLIAKKFGTVNQYFKNLVKILCVKLSKYNTLINETINASSSLQCFYQQKIQNSQKKLYFLKNFY